MNFSLLRILPLYLFGQGDAIRRVAENRQAPCIGIALVLLTAIARHYDQLHISENPFLWVFGPLLFSLISGTWLYLVVYGGFARREMAPPIPAFWSGWRSFMGLFWMTAPVAWIYAIPVERFFDSIMATRANLVLLGVVSAWRVLLMARVIQRLTTARFAMALGWVLVAAAVEVLVVYLFSHDWAKAVMSAMGGMRNSPQEEILRRAMGIIINVAFWSGPVFLMIALWWRARQPLTPLPAPVTSPMPWTALAAAAVLWIAVAIVPQRELANNVAVEKMIANSQARAALDFLSAHSPAHFAPSRTLPPKAFEYSVFTELPDCFGAVQPTHAPWVRAHLLQRLEEMRSHYSPWRRRRDPHPPRDEMIADMANRSQFLGPGPEGWLKVMDGLERIPEGRRLLAADPVFVPALVAAARDAPERSYRGSDPTKDRVHWLALSNRVRAWLPAAGAPTETNVAPLPGSPPAQ
jgi:hypothetical protein